MPKKGEAWTVCRFRGGGGGVGKKEGGVVFEGGLIPRSHHGLYPSRGSGRLELYISLHNIRVAARR